MRRRGFTLIELLVVIAIIAILAAILFPLFTRAKLNAQATACLNNCKQLALALSMYADNWNDRFPTQLHAEGDENYADWYDGSGGWCKKIYPYVRCKSAYICPASKYFTKYGVSPNGNVGYVMNGVYCVQGYLQPRLRGSVRNPSRVVLLWESQNTPEHVAQSSPWSRGYPNRNRARWPYFDCGDITKWRLQTHDDRAMYVFLDCHAKQLDVQCTFSMFDDRLRP